MRPWRATLLVLAACGTDSAIVGTLDASVDDALEASVVDVDAASPADAGEESAPFPYRLGHEHCGACPADMPEAGTACTQQTLDCEYGDHPDFRCNTHVQCRGPLPWDGGTWQTFASFCARPTTCAPPMTGGACSDAVDLGHCSSLGTICSTDAGLCVCGYFGYPFWSCTRPCATPRPRMGCDCDPKTLCLDYSTLPEGLTCKDGIVQWGWCIPPP